MPLPPRSDERFADWVDGRLSPAERRRMQRDLERDAALREALRGYEETVELLRRRAADERAPANLADAVLARLDAPDAAADDGARVAPARRWFPLAGSLAAAAALVAIGVFLWQLAPGRPHRDDTAALARRAAGNARPSDERGQARDDSYARRADEPVELQGLTAFDRAGQKEGRGAAKQAPQGQAAAQEEREVGAVAAPPKSGAEPSAAAPGGDRGAVGGRVAQLGKAEAPAAPVQNEAAPAPPEEEAVAEKEARTATEQPVSPTALPVPLPPLPRPEESPPAEAEHLAKKPAAGAPDGAPMRTVDAPPAGSELPYDAQRAAPVERDEAGVGDELAKSSGLGAPVVIVTLPRDALDALDALDAEEARQAAQAEQRAKAAAAGEADPARKAVPGWLEVPEAAALEGLAASGRLAGPELVELTDHAAQRDDRAYFAAANERSLALAPGDRVFAVHGSPAELESWLAHLRSAATARAGAVQLQRTGAEQEVWLKRLAAATDVEDEKKEKDAGERARAQTRLRDETLGGASRAATRARRLQPVAPRDTLWLVLRASK